MTTRTTIVCRVDLLGSALKTLADLEAEDRIGAGDAVIVAAGIDAADDPGLARQERYLALEQLAAGYGEIDRCRLHQVAAGILPHLASWRRTELVDELVDAYRVFDALADGDPAVVERFADLPANGVSHQAHRLAMCDEQVAAVEFVLRAAVA